MKFLNQAMRDIPAWGTMKNYFTTQEYLQRFLKERVGTTDNYQMHRQ